MDFRTIVEERISLYTSIDELRNDLVVMCTNCITYNRDRSLYTRTARYAFFFRF